MFKFTELKSIHLEISNNCQASCPMCSRNVHGGLENPLIKINEWTIDDFKKIINQEVLNQIDQIYFCGNFGDPILNNDLIKMCSYVKDNSNVMIRIHTNGSLRNKKWWKLLAESLPKRHSVVFGIDGLKDTHEIYRIGTDFDKIIENAKSFISAGGLADWAFIVFQHNQHQVEQAKKLAYEIGFKLFLTKNSSRFVASPQFPVYDKNGNTTYYLEPPSETTIKFIDKKTIENYKTIVDMTEIDCYVKSTKEIYIDAYKNILPCCFLASTPYNYQDPNSDIFHLRQIALDQYHELVRDLGEINTLKKSVREIIDSQEYQTVWDKYWNDKKLLTCVRTCGKTDLSKPKDQFIETVNLE
jgi:MoaA/NifB/PqqE/SkfB family radical SAM enzyme